MRRVHCVTRVSDLQDVVTLDHVARHRQIRAQFTIQTRQIEIAADVREETNGRLGHSVHGALRSHAERAIDSQAAARTH